MRSGFIILFLITCLVACDSSNKFDQYKSIDIEKGWGKKDLAFFKFDIKDSLSVYDLYVNIRNNNDYEYNNIYLITKIKYPDGHAIVDTLEYEMTDKFGKWLGDGFTDIKQNKLYFRENFVFPVAGTYQVSIQHAMRKRDQIKGIDYLKGISDVGFRVESISK